MRSLRLLTVALLLVSSAACDENGGGVEDTSDLAGTWDATKFEVTNPANTSQKFDLITLGFEFTITIANNGSYTSISTFPGEAPESDTGTVVAEGDILIVRVDGMMGQMEFDLTLSGDTMTLTGADSEYDFDDDGDDEAAKLDMVLERR